MAWARNAMCGSALRLHVFPEFNITPKLHEGIRFNIIQTLLSTVTVSVHISASTSTAV